MAQQTVGELVAQDYRRASVFKWYGIDFCCGGDETLESACAAHQIPLGEIERALQINEQSPAASSMCPETWAPGFLADYIVHVHHTYVRESIPPLRDFTRKVAHVHGGKHPELTEIAQLFDELAQELLRHTGEEEAVLFPYIKALEKAWPHKVEVARTYARDGGGEEGHIPERVDTVQDPIQLMEDDHRHAGATMRRIRALSSDFTPPEKACSTYRVTYAKLEEFEEDLHRHVHLESNVLFPKAAALEAASK